MTTSSIRLRNVFYDLHPNGIADMLGKTDAWLLGYKQGVEHGANARKFSTLVDGHRLDVAYSFDSNGPVMSTVTIFVHDVDVTDLVSDRTLSAVHDSIKQHHATE